MTDGTDLLDQADSEVLAASISDEALEAAAGTETRWLSIGWSCGHATVCGDPCVGA